MIQFFLVNQKQCDLCSLIPKQLFLMNTHHTSNLYIIDQSGAPVSDSWMKDS